MTLDATSHSRPSEPPEDQASQASSRRSFFRGLAGETRDRVLEAPGVLAPLGLARLLVTPNSVRPQLAHAGPTPPPAPPERSVRAGRAPGRCATSDHLLALAHANGIGARRDDLEQFARTSVHLAPIESVEGQRQRGSRIGGSTTLPCDVPWPRRKGSPLNFIAQIDLSELPPQARSRTLPDSGTLLFFYDLMGAPRGLSADEADAGRVIFLDLPGAVTCARTTDGELSGHGVDLAPELVLPRVWADSVQRLELDPHEQLGWETVREMLSEFQGTTTGMSGAGFTSVHHLLGYPDEKRGGMPLSCELLERGHDVSDGLPHAHPAAAELKERSERWRLLLQLSIGSGVWHGALRPESRLYFWADEESLERGDFSAARVIRR